MPQKAKVSIERCPDYLLDNVRRTVKKCLNDLGGLERWVKKGDKVLIKPNLLSAKEPEKAVTTHPSLVQVVIEEVKKIGALPVIGDSPGGVEKGIERLWKATQMSLAAKNTDTPLLSFEKTGVYKKIASNGRVYHLAQPSLDCDVIINLPKLKTHTLTLFTCAVKNMFGTIPGFRKGEYHKEAPKPYEFAEVLVDIFSLAKPQITLVDAIVCMDGDGPSSGQPKYLGLILASEDAIAIDTVAAKIMGFKEGEIDTTKIAVERKLGIGDLSQIEILGESLESVLSGTKNLDLKLPSNRFLRLIPKFAVKLLAPYLWVRPAILDGNCTNCNICVENCPAKTISPGDPTPVYDYTHCINCMCCHELCPSRAIYMEKSWLSKKIGR